VSDADDRTLVDAVAGRGDERAFGILYDRHTPAMHGLALRLTGGSESDAEDIVHDAWIRAVERCADFEWRSTLRSWLCGFVVLRWREALRRSHREPVVPLRDDAVATTDVVLDFAAERVDLERAVRGLADGYREVLVLHDIEGFTHEEIGRMLGIETGTSKSQLSRARHAVRKALTHSGEEPRNGRP
jgi:RNA polymerase sigma-70 factor (ECF subfamily)